MLVKYFWVSFIYASITIFHMNSIKHLSSSLFCFKILKWHAGEMSQWIRALAALAVDTGSVPSIHMVVYNHL